MLARLHKNDFLGFHPPASYLGAQEDSFMHSLSVGVVLDWWHKVNPFDPLQAASGTRRVYPIVCLATHFFKSSAPFRLSHSLLPRIILANMVVVVIQ